MQVNLNILIFPNIFPDINCHIPYIVQFISQHVHLHEDQLETVMSVLEESNVEIRHNLHKLLSTCKLSSQVCLSVVYIF